MKTLITKIWKHLLSILCFFVGVWVFNHISAWFGIVVAVIALIYLIHFIFNSTKKYIED